MKEKTRNKREEESINGKVSMNEKKGNEKTSTQNLTKVIACVLVERFSAHTKRKK